MGVRSPSPPETSTSQPRAPSLALLANERSRQHSRLVTKRPAPFLPSPRKHRPSPPLLITFPAFSSSGRKLIPFARFPALITRRAPRKEAAPPPFLLSVVRCALVLPLSEECSGPAGGCARGLSRPRPRARSLFPFPVYLAAARLACLCWRVCTASGVRVCERGNISVQQRIVAAVEQIYLKKLGMGESANVDFCQLLIFFPVFTSDERLHPMRT
ncbi:uncharacterized protein LOC133374485 [Rhineura floridana]|uniref:uncharacterized protein LOC133374485 n=1 Tax=Rhineura floridana TaxID=261503 RepID=UPI002AC88083|nr:uncharacterized protein LOC133374485 [Rhineura floridana]